MVAQLGQSHIVVVQTVLWLFYVYHCCHREKMCLVFFSQTKVLVLVFPWQYLKASHGLMKSISLRLVMNVQYLKVWLTFSLFPFFFWCSSFFQLSSFISSTRDEFVFLKNCVLKRKKGIWFYQRTAPNTNASTFLTISGVRCRWVFPLFEITWNFLTFFFFFFAWLSQAVKCCCKNCAGLGQKWPCGFVKRQTKQKKIKTSTQIIW